MRRDRHLTAIGLAHALLAGAPRRDALLARGAAALGRAPAWLALLIDQLLPGLRARWSQMTVALLAERLRANPLFVESSGEDRRPAVRRWILRGSHMLPRPLGLDQLVLPRLDHSEALAHWLGISQADLLWFAAPAPVHRQRPLHRQHYAFSIRPKRTQGGDSSKRRARD